MISVDGDTSTNDTVLILANGSANNKMLVEDSSSLKVFADALDYITSKLARLIVRDGEGATKLIEIYVKGTNARHAARSIAFAIARSNLVKTAFFGEDPNWGRIVASAGTAGISFDPNKLDLFFDQEQVVKNGVDCSRERKMEIENVLKKRDILLTINLNSGNEEARVLTSDLSLDYVKINALYSS
jgi:glutamate N-acetyltransferase/amino-acid N-acetyltransferase